MTTLGIFGDSFGDWDVGEGRIVNGKPLKELSWPYLLATKLEAVCINTAQGGSSLFYGYNQFIKHESQCDIVVFLLTNPGRYTLPMTFKNALPNRIHPNGLHTIDYWLSRKDITDVEREKLLYLKGFYISIDFQWEHTACNLLVKEIKRLRPDTIFIPCFEFYKDILDGDPISLENIQKLQLKSIGLDLSTYDAVTQYAETGVTCHFTPETNELVANWVFDSIQKKKWTCNLPNHIPHQFTWEHYYTKIKK